MNRFTEIYAGLPRAARWLVWFVAGVVAFIAINDYVLVYHDRWSSRADRLAADLSRLRALGTSESDQGRMIAEGMVRFGRPSLPAPAAQVGQALTRRVNDVFDNAGILDRTQIEKGGSFKALTSDQRFERVIIEITFEADPRVVTQVVADLEASPEVTCISRLREDKSQTSSRAGGSSRSGAGVGLVRATIAAEAWALPQSSR